MNATAASNIYFLACAFHPGLDVAGTKAAWYAGMIHHQPRLRDQHQQLCRRHVVDSDFRLPELIYLLRASMSFEGEDFIHVFDVFGRWILTALNHIMRAATGHSHGLFPYEAEFVQDTIHDLASCLSHIPLRVRLAFTRICLRHTYRQIILEATRFHSSLGRTCRPDMLTQKMFRWILDCVLASDLEPKYKNRISTWIRDRGLDQLLTSDGPVGLMIPGQRVLSRLALTVTLVDQSQTEEASLELEDVEFVLCGPDLQPMYYARPVVVDSRLNSEICTVCMGDLADEPGEAYSIDACGHLAHHDCLGLLMNDVQPWSNKCPVCRQQICPPRATRALIPDDEGEDQEFEDENEEWEDTEYGGHAEEVEERWRDPGSGDRRGREDSADMCWSA